MYAHAIYTAHKACSLADAFLVIILNVYVSVFAIIF